MGPEGAHQAIQLRETEPAGNTRISHQFLPESDRPGYDCSELLTVNSVHGEEGVQSVRRNTVGQVEVLA